MTEQEQEQVPGRPKRSWRSFFMPFLALVYTLQERMARPVSNVVRERKRVDKPDTPEQLFYKRHGVQPATTLGIADKVENGYIILTCTASLVFFTIILGYGNGFFFSGMRDIALTLTWTGMMYIGGFLIETTATSALITAKRNYKRHKRVFVWGMFGFFFLAFISAIAQYILYHAQIDRGVIDLPQTALNRIPIFSFLLGDSTTEWFIWGRALVFHACILIATLLIPTRRIDIEATKQQIQEVQEADAAIKRTQHMAETEAMMHETMMALWRTYNANFQRFMAKSAAIVVESTLADMPASNGHNEEADKEVLPKE